MSIKVLSALVANQIAAGEVVEGPLSIVKELVENSIDAGSDAISIEVSKQMRYIKVSDNGSGIPEDELSLAFTRHATSKISDIEDLFSIQSNGFRGEALASIASVSKITCVSRTKNANHASKFYTDGIKEEKSETGAAIGTSIEVDELFYNTPARLKFMKANSREKQTIIDLIKAFAIFNSEISFELNIDNKSIFKSLKNQPFKSLVKDLFGLSAFEHLININYNTGDIKISGYISAPELNRSDKRYYFIAVNKRIIKCNTIRAALDKVYKDILPQKKYPIAIINLELAAAEVDVNVHPRKQEVKYLHTNEIYRSLINVFSNNLSDYFYKCSEYHPLELFNPLTVETNQHLETVVSQPSIFSTDYQIPVKQWEEPIAREKVLNSGIEVQQESQIEVKQECEATRSNLSFISRLSPIDIHLVSGDLSDYSEGINYDENSELFKIFSASDDLSFGVLVSGRLNYLDESLKEIYLESLKSFTEKLSEAEDSQKAATEATNLYSGRVAEGTSSRLRRTNDRSVSSIHEDHEDDENAEVGVRLHAHSRKEKKTHVNLSRPKDKASLKQLEEIWERDHYSCVYCGKALIHPKLVKEALKKATATYFSRLNSKNEKIQEHVIEAHKASYDHHLPASKFAVLNLDTRNLFSVCRECNQKKSASLASKTWSPKIRNAWSEVSINNPLELAGVKFISALEAVYDH